MLWWPEVGIPRVGGNLRSGDILPGMRQRAKLDLDVNIDPARKTFLSKEQGGGWSTQTRPGRLDIILVRGIQTLVDSRGRTDILAQMSRMLYT